MNINALLGIWQTLHSQYNLKFLLTGRLNQDCVENLFSVIRAKGGPRDNPDAGQFRAAFAQVTTFLMMANTFCEVSLCTLDVISSTCMFVFNTK